MRGSKHQPAIRSEDREIRYLHREEVERLFQAIPPANTRDRLLFALIYLYGLRVSEATRLILGQFDLEHRQVTITGIKHGLKGVYPIYRDVWPLLRRWIRQERANAGPEDPLFTSREGEGITRFRVHQLFKGYARAAGIRLTERQSVHTLRHSLAVHMLDAGLTTDDVRDMLRHRSISSSAVYARVSIERRNSYLRHLERSPAVARLR